MPTAFEHLKNIKWGLGFFLSAVVWAVFVVTTIQAYLGGTQYESPLLLTLLAVTASTMAVGVITAGVSSSAIAATDEHVAETATAAYVFANAAGTLATLIGHLAETWETGRATNDVGSHDALTIILDLLSLKPETYFISYLVVTGLFAALAFPLVLWGAQLIVGKHVAEPSELAGVGVLSLCLLVMGLLVGTPWAPVGEDTRAAMTAYGAGLRLTTLVLIVLSFAIYALLVVLSLGRFAAVFSFSAIRMGGKIGGENMLALAWQLIRQFFYGLLIGLAAVCIIGLMWFFGVPLVAAIPTVSGDAGTRFVEAATQGLVDAAVWLLWASAAAAAVLLLRLFGKATIKGIAQLIGWAVVGLFNLIKLFIAFLFFIIGVVIEGVMVSVRFVAWLFRPRAKLTTTDPAKPPKPAKGGWFSDAWSRVAPKLSRPTIDWGSIAKLVAGVAVFGVLAVGSVWAYNALRDLFPPQPEAPPEPITSATPEAPPPPAGFEFATAQPISLCEASPGGFNWALARDDRLEVALNDCVLPSRVHDAKNGVLVVVSVSSPSDNETEEKQRALRRARALAGWASLRTPSGMPVYVLNLGMARSERAFGIGWQRLFGDVQGVRPALASLLTPYPDGSTLPVSGLLQELANGLRYANVSTSFTDCQLLKFNPAPAAATEPEAVTGFDCAAL